MTDHEATAHELQLLMLRYDVQVEVHSLEVIALERLAKQPVIDILIADSAMEQSHQLARLASMKNALRIVALVRAGHEKPAWDVVDATLVLPTSDDDMDAALGSKARVLPAPEPGADTLSATRPPRVSTHRPARERGRHPSSGRGRPLRGGKRTTTGELKVVRSDPASARSDAQAVKTPNPRRRRSDNPHERSGSAALNPNQSNLGRRSGSDVRNQSGLGRSAGADVRNQSGMGRRSSPDRSKNRRRNPNHSSGGITRRKNMSTTNMRSRRAEANRSNLGSSSTRRSSSAQGRPSTDPNQSGLGKRLGPLAREGNVGGMKMRRDGGMDGNTSRPGQYVTGTREWSSQDAVEARRGKRSNEPSLARPSSFGTPLPPAGSFDGMPLSSVLFKLFMQHRTGVLLIVRKDGEQCDFCFKDGEPVGLGGAVSRDELGESLVRLGHVALGDLMELLRSSSNLDQELLRKKLVTPAQLKEARALLVFDQLVTCFGWDNARYAFNEGGDVWQTIEPLNPMQVIYEGLTHNPGHAAMRERLEARAHEYIERTDRLDAFVDYLPAEPWIASVLDACDGNATLVEVVEMFPRHEDECLGLLYLLLEGQMLRLFPSEHRKGGTLARHNTPVPRAVSNTPSADASQSSSSSRPPGNFSVGDTLSNRYRVEELIGEGSTSLVYRARDMELDEEIALKVFTIGEVSPEYLPRFRQELSIARSLAHPNVIRVYDISTFNGLKYITMELLRGDVLHQLMDGPLDFDQGLDYLIQACKGLQAAHDRDIIHRDVKPENFFITHEGVLKVMDFGIAKRTSSRMTLIGFAAGTPAYMSPEQIETFTSVTVGSDIYALGVAAHDRDIIHRDVKPEN
ncbi:MAG: protein kinase, partial [Myxococcota bacterium]